MSAPSQKRLLSVHRPGSIHMVGDGFHVRNLFPSNELGEDISPFLLLDYAGPTQYGPTDRPRGVGEHPHRGFETVTIVRQGEIEHRDSAGNAGRIGPGDVQWMTAASGVVHEERHAREFARRGGTVEMVQLWVNLPRRHKMSAPRYQEIPSARIPVVDLPDGAGRARVIAGELLGVRGPAETFSPLHLVELELAPGKTVELELPEGHTCAVVCLDGDLTVGGGARLEDAMLALLSRTGRSVRLEAHAATHTLVLGGEPLGEPVVAHGPFVMSTGQEIHQAIRDYQEGRMGHLA